MNPPSNGPARILVVDDERGMREVLSVLLEREGHAVTVAGDGAEALEKYGGVRPDVVLVDVRMPKMDGIAFLRALKGRDPGAIVIVMTAYSTWDSAVEAMRLGAFDYFRKPFDNREIRATVARALSARRTLRAGGDAGMAKVAAMVGHGPAMQEIFAVVRRVGPTDSTVCITGESGTGKELIARALHSASPRAGGPFITVNCGAFVETLLESEIFGHVRGAFTGSVSDRKGLFEVADGGSLFLDEIGEMAPPTQVKFLRVLEERRYAPVGASETRPVDVRIIAATNKDLSEEVEAGRFREDLYYRLDVIPIHLPPLRERREDVPLLAGQFLARYARTMRKGVSTLSKEAMELLLAYDWPGNIRELENVIQRAVALSEGPEIVPHDLAGRFAERGKAAGGADPAAIPPGGMDLEAHVEAVERRFLEEALRRTGGHLTKAAELLGMTFRAIRYKVAKHGLKRAGQDGGGPA
ncbi:MAG: sigma-54 dependent transcriptional regulator [Planctomycetales bacterium]|nr:sigma-54 dependent transcriptional regulator [Planctomycetales bacterium]